MTVANASCAVGCNCHPEILSHRFWLAVSEFSTMKFIRSKYKMLKGDGNTNPWEGKTNRLWWNRIYSHWSKRLKNWKRSQLILVLPFGPGLLELISKKFDGEFVIVEVMITLLVCGDMKINRPDIYDKIIDYLVENKFSLFFTSLSRRRSFCIISWKF